MSFGTYAGLLYVSHWRISSEFVSSVQKRLNLMSSESFLLKLSVSMRKKNSFYVSSNGHIDFFGRLKEVYFNDSNTFIICGMHLVFEHRNSWCTWTIDESHPLHRIDECIDSLGKAHIFSMIDRFNGYWKTKIYEQEPHKMLFVCHFGTFHYIRSPFRLTKTP